MEPIQYLRTIRRRWVLILAFCVLGGLLGAAAGLGHKKAAGGTTYYRATCVLYYDASNVSQQGTAFTALAQMGLLATTGDVPAKIAQQRNTNPEDLTTRVLAVTDTQQSTLRITTVGTSATDTNALSDAWCQALADKVNGINTASYTDQVNTLARTLDGLTNQINTLQAQNPGANTVNGQKLQALINQYRLDDEQFQALGQPPGKILTVLQRPTPIPVSSAAYTTFLHNGQAQNNNVTLSNNTKNPETSLDSSTSSKTKIPQGPIPRGLIGAFLGLMLGLVIAFVIERLDTRLQTKEDTEQAFDLPVLAEVPPLTRPQRSDTEVLSYTHPMSRTAEAYRSLRSSLLFLRQTMESEPSVAGAPGNGAGEGESAGRTSQVILVTSAGPAEGKTTSVANLAAVFAEAEYSVLVINCDFRRPRLHRYLGGSEEPRKVVQSDIPGVRMVNNVVSSSHPNPAEVTAAQRRVIEAARGIFDVILLDTAPLLSTNDASELIGVADLVLLVSRAGKTTRPQAQRATEVLHRLEATVAGVAMLGARYIPSAQYYYYATEDGRDPNRADAESHPLDLLVRADDLNQARPNGAPTGAPTHAVSPMGDDERLEVELQGSAGSPSTKDE
jgi:Mrp family chromosome partitioning ATPase